MYSLSLDREPYYKLLGFVFPYCGFVGRSQGGRVLVVFSACLICCWADYDDQMRLPENAPPSFHTYVPA